MSAKHTPTPWKHVEAIVEGRAGTVPLVAVAGWGGRNVAECSFHDDARFIVQACNAHDGLVEALKAILEKADDGELTTRMRSTPRVLCGATFFAISELARAALAKATANKEG